MMDWDKEFSRGFLDAVVWSLRDMNDETESDKSLREMGYNGDDVADWNMGNPICREVFRFVRVAIEHKLLTIGESDFYQAGIDFCLTRGREGTGFWDKARIYGEEESKLLTLMSECFEWLGAYVEDGMVYLETV